MFIIFHLASGKDSKILIRCGNETLTPAPPVTRKPSPPPTEEPTTTTGSTTTETEPTTLPPSGKEGNEKPEISDDEDSRSDETNNNIPREDMVENKDADNHETSRNEDTLNERLAAANTGGSSMRPTVPPNLSFEDIGRPENKVTSSVSEEANNEDQNDPNKQTNTPDFNPDGGRTDKDDSDLNLIPSDAESEGTYPPPFPFSPSEAKDANQSPNEIQNGETVHSDSPNSKISQLEDTTTSSIQYYPANDLAEEMSSTTTTTTTAPTITTTTISPKDIVRDLHNIEQETLGTSKEPSLDVKPPKDFERTYNQERESISNKDFHHQDTNTFKDSDANTSQNITEPVDTDRESKQTQNTEYQYDLTEETITKPVYPPFDTHGDTIGTRTPDNREPIVPLPDEYEDEYNYIEDLEPEDNDQIPIDTIDRQELDPRNDIIQGRETGQNFHDITEINSIHDVSKDADSKGHPVDLNIPRGTGGNFTFNSTAKNTTGNCNILVVCNLSLTCQCNSYISRF